MLIIRCLQFFCFLGLIYFVPLSAQSSWDFVEKKGEIVLLEQTVPREKIKNFKGITKIHAPLAQVASILNDPAHYTRWIPRTKTSFSQERQKEGFLFYLRIKGPFLFWDRETYLFTQVRCENQGDHSLENKRISISFTTEHSQAKQVPSLEDKVIRLPKMEGHWYIWPAENPQETYVEYQAFIDGGGQLTNYFKNSAVKLWIPKMLTNLQKRVTQVGPPDWVRLQKEAPQLFPNCLSSPSGVL